ncbi:hypothetical protein QWY93_11805 [Echinicola jeungdonensis]|uniref:Integral membrane protein n=1 Tax=Echinicola jeungdonensis TaxID=709343 RepID=A0ABV5J9G2_9BACT|nr:hypothetical protein [Echinicola jeungdonensis]MDN3670012.1 hypothetical protein [Echinicola jeungdonensis]
MEKRNLERLIANGYDFDIAQAIQNGWELFTRKPTFSIGFAGFFVSSQLLAMIYLQNYATIYNFLLTGPLVSGFYLVANKIKSNEEITYADFFKGFEYYVPIILIWGVGQLLVFLGFVALIIPGIYLMVAYNFSVLISVFTGFNFWDSLEYSRKIITVRWWKFFILSLLLIVMNIVGGLLVLGLLVSFPLTFYITYCVFEEITSEVLQEA